MNYFYILQYTVKTFFRLRCMRFCEFLTLYDKYNTVQMGIAKLKLQSVYTSDELTNVLMFFDTLNMWIQLDYKCIM